jgi:restriction endonuclease S subunit
MSFALSKSIHPNKVFLTRKSEIIGRCDPNYYRYMAEFLGKIRKCAFPIKRLNSLLALVQYGSSVRATNENVGTPMLRMINLQDDSWDLSDLKYIKMNAVEQKSYRLEPGDLLFNRTNSKELVGKCNVFDLPGDYVFASYLIRVRTKTGKLAPDYVAAFLASSLGRVQIDAVSRQIAGMTNINAEEIRNLLIPVPELDFQQKIVQAWKTAIQKRDATNIAARKMLFSVDDLLLEELGIAPKPPSPNTLKNRIFLRAFSAATGNRIDPLYHHGDTFHFVRAAKCRLAPLGTCVTTFLTGFVAGRDEQGDEEGGIIQIRPTNLSDDRELIFRRNVYIERADLEQRPLDLLQRREVLFNNTNSQEQVGKTVFFNLEGQFFCSNHITRIATDASRLNPQFLAHLLNLYQRQQVFFKLCTNWNNQSGVGVDVLEEIPVPLPDPKRQEQIVAHLEKVRTDARTMRRQAAAELHQAKKSIEAMILGKELQI